MVVKKVIQDEEVVEMGQDGNGTYHPIAVVKVEDRSVARNDAIKDLPRWFPAMYEVINGFTIGLGAIENFMMNMKRINRRRKNVHMD